MHSFFILITNRVITINKYLVEFLGTFWLVFGGSAVLAAAFTELGIGF